MSSVAPIVAVGDAVASARRRSGAAAWPPEPPPEEGGGGGGGAGAAVTVKLAALVAVPPGVVTLIAPVAAPAGTVAVICVPETTVNPAGEPANRTAVAPPRFVPVIVTTVDSGPLAGAKDASVGAGGGGGGACGTRW